MAPKIQPIVELIETPPPSKGEMTKSCLKLYWKLLFVVLWPLVTLPITVNSASLALGWTNSRHLRCLWCMVVMGGYWVTECIPLPITGLMPMFMFPLLNILDSEQTAMQYFKDVNMMFMGGMFLAIAIEDSKLHVRTALFTIKCVGCKPRQLHLGLCFIAMLLSMWLVNAATTAMMCPILKAVLDEFEKQGIGNFYEEQTQEDIDNEEPLKPTKTTICFYLGIAYSTTIGGLGTLVGTPTNLAFKGFLDAAYNEKVPLDFAFWILLNLVNIMVDTVLNWLCLQFIFLGMFRPKSKEGEFVRKANDNKAAAYQAMVQRYKELGPMTWPEKWVGGLFLVCVVLWLFQSPKVISGWADEILKYALIPTAKTAEEIAKGKKGYIKSSCPAYIIVFLLVIIPNTPAMWYCCSKHEEKRPAKKYQGIVGWPVLQSKMSWGVLFLLGGGFAIAKAGADTGMNKWLGEIMQKAMDGFDPFGASVLFAIAASIFTEITSNVACCSIYAPIILTVTKNKKWNPYILGLPTAVACSFAYMLPVGTPANSIVMSYAGIRTKDMCIGGIVVKIVTLAICFFSVFVYGLCFYKLDYGKDLEVL